MADNRCVRIYDLKQKIQYHPEVGTYVSEEDIDLAERVFCDDSVLSEVKGKHKVMEKEKAMEILGTLEGLKQSCLSLHSDSIVYHLCEVIQQIVIEITPKE